MDFKMRSKAWVGNIYRKFESMCEEVDDFINKDTMKYVGDQVQTVGENMKRFYSDVVQDFLPPLVNPVELEGQAMRRKQSNASAETESSFDNDGDAAICRSSYLGFKESMTIGAQGSHSSDNTSSESLRSSLHDVGPTTAQKDETLSKSFSDDLNLVLSSQIILKGGITKEVEVVTEESCSTEYLNASKSQLLSALLLETELRASQEDEMVSTRDVTDFVSEGSSMLVEKFVTGESTSSDDKTLSKALMISTGEDYKDPIIAKLSPTIQLHDTDEGREFTDDGTVCSSFSNASCQVFDASHYQRQLHGKTMRVEQSLNVESSSSEDIALQSHAFSINQDHESQEAEKLWWHADSTECFSGVSSGLKSPMPSATFSCVNNAIDVMPDFSSSAWSSDFRGASEDNIKHCCQLNQLPALVLPVEIDPCMETIDLSDKEKQDSSCVLVDTNKPLYAVPSRPRRFKSYKKLIQDALASRKRLINEYKQLAIWYGDIDAESRQHSGDSPITIPATSLHSSHSCKSCESGWELL